MEKWLEQNSAEIEALRKGEMTSLTNLGAYRAYMVEYLVNHRDIDPKMPVMVRDMPPGEAGMPVELYCFSKINSWVPFESVQSGILDYAFAVAGQFGLKLFQVPSGNDFVTFSKVIK
jgi:miniconductance mechanosensitive channel